MNNIKVLDKEFTPYISKVVIESAIARMANQINKDMSGKNPLFLVMLNGAFMFASELLKNINLDCETSFVKYSTYSGMESSYEVKELIGLNNSIQGRNIVIVEDIIDSGFTMNCLLQKLESLGVASIKIATMLFKPEAFQFDYKIDYIGMNIGNEFIVGYGLDYNEHGRNYPLIYKVIE